MPDLTLTLNELLAAELRAHAARNSLSGAQVARNADLPPMYVHRRLSGAASITVEDLVAICEAIGVNPLDVLGQLLAAGAEPAHPPVVAGT